MIVQDHCEAACYKTKNVLGGLVSHCQSAFGHGRQLLDGVLITNKIIDLATRDKKECVMFKVDFEKAYDYVS